MITPSPSPLAGPAPAPPTLAHGTASEGGFAGALVTALAADAAGTDPTAATAPAATPATGEPGTAEVVPDMTIALVAPLALDAIPMTQEAEAAEASLLPPADGAGIAAPPLQGVIVAEDGAAALLLPDELAAPSETEAAEALAAPVTLTAAPTLPDGMTDGTAPVVAPAASLPADAPAPAAPTVAPQSTATSPAGATAPATEAKAPIAADAPSSPPQNVPAPQRLDAAPPAIAEAPASPGVTAATDANTPTPQAEAGKAAAPAVPAAEAPSAETIARNPAAASVTVQAAGPAPRVTRPASPALSGAVSPAGVMTLNAVQEAITIAAPMATPAPANDLVAADASPAAQPGIALVGDTDRAAAIELSVEDAADEAAIAKAEPRADAAGTDARTEARQAPTPASAQASGQPSGQASSPATMQGLAATAPGLSAPTPSAQAVAQAPRAPMTPPAQQIMPVVVTLAGGMGGAAASVTITLDPIELGRVAISVQRDAEQRASVQVVAERPETLLLLLRDQAGLDRALAQAGVGPEGRTLSFDLAPNDQQQRDGRPENGQPGEGGGRRRDDRSSPLAAEAIPISSASASRQRALGALDIAV